MRPQLMEAKRTHVNNCGHCLASTSHLGEHGHCNTIIEMLTPSMMSITVLLIVAMCVRFYVQRKHKHDINGSHDTSISSSISSASYRSDFEKMLELYRSQGEERRRILKDVINKNSGDYSDLYSILVPEVYCIAKVRVGSVNDGGKWMCNPFWIPKDSFVFSLGLHDEISFEAELQRITNQCCYIIGFDRLKQKAQTQQMLSSIRAKSKKAWISNTTDEEKENYTIDYLMKLENITHIEVLKMDIEGSELDVLPGFLEEHHPAQIMVEVHHSSSMTARLLQCISRQGYWLFSHEINGAFHHVSEYSFIHESVFPRYGASPISRYLN
ncbi:hypothetical protein Y032_0197g1574 [Ancylostoma ceylanicum]|uniref:Methyltransferase domain-containing protein n=1 Tax=Ancylostoma ceylanicum TaxID=53326 RepID=A0A016SNA0_9BILA|nr:hypothetical protein Y032_0197g1574 [Ancylostoma ceylanicum]